MLPPSISLLDLMVFPDHKRTDAVYQITSQRRCKFATSADPPIPSSSTIIDWLSRHSLIRTNSRKPPPRYILGCSGYASLKKTPDLQNPVMGYGERRKASKDLALCQWKITLVSNDACSQLVKVHVRHDRDVRDSTSFEHRSHLNCDFFAQSKQGCTIRERLFCVFPAHDAGV